MDKINETRYQLLKRVGNMKQLCGVTSMTINDGKSEGIRAFELYNRAGLHFNVLQSRCMDIYQLSYKGIGIPFISKPGLVAAQHTDLHGVNFLRSIGGGMLYTCGLSNVGNAYKDDEKDDIFHGRLRFIPAENVASFAEWLDDQYVIGVKGEMRDASLFKDNLVLKRTVKTSLDSKTIEIEDIVENQGFEIQDLMMMYHINIGYPVIDRGTRVLIPSLSVAAMNEASMKNKDSWADITDTVDGCPENVFVHHVKKNADGKVYASVYNQNLQLGLAISFNHLSMNKIVQWKSMMSGDYVMGIFPSNNHGSGKGYEQEHGGVAFIQPFQKINMGVKMTILDGEDDYQMFLEKFKTQA